MSQESTEGDKAAAMKCMQTRSPTHAGLSIVSQAAMLMCERSKKGEKKKIKK